MKRFNITPELLSSYYDNRFDKDLKTVFEFEEKDGITFTNKLSKALLSFGKMDSKPEREYPDEEHLLFIVLTAFVFASERAIYTHSEDTDNKEIASLFNSFGLPWISCVPEIDLSWFLETTKIGADVIIKNEAEAIRSTIDIVKPFMINRLCNFAKTWKEGDFYRRNKEIDCIEKYISDVVNASFQGIYRHLYGYKGLLGIDLSRTNIIKYYNDKFYNDFEKYFSEAKHKDGYLQLLYVNRINNRRWEDGNPANNISENMIFSAIVLYMCIAERSILKNAEDIELHFHQYTGWPFISSGPGVGPFLHPLRMIDEAGISPLKNESYIYLDVVKEVFSLLRQEMNCMLNGRKETIKDKPSAKIFLNYIRDNGVKSNIKNDLDINEKHIQELILKWATSSADNWWELLEENGCK